MNPGDSTSTLTLGPWTFTKATTWGPLGAHEYRFYVAGETVGVPTREVTPAEVEWVRRQQCAGDGGDAERQLEQLARRTYPRCPSIGLGGENGPMPYIVANGERLTPVGHRCRHPEGHSGAHTGPPDYAELVTWDAPKGGES